MSDFTPAGEPTDFDLEMISLRRHLHSCPELSYEEFSTSELIASRLAEWGYTIHRGIGKTGVVGQLRLGDGKRRLGLRADMDALPIHEQTGLPYASTAPGKMHACGHDGHTAMLLSAAGQLARSRSFNGTLNLFFQPAEESGAGAKQMLDDGLLERFPCDAVFAIHNMPGIPAGKFGFLAGPFMASVDDMDIVVNGRGGHGGLPHMAIDPVVVCAQIVLALQTIVSRGVAPLDVAVITVGAIHAGHAPNVIPDSAVMRLSVRTLKPEMRSFLKRRITDVAIAQAAVYGASAEVCISDDGCPVLVNDHEMTQFARRVALEWRGEDAVMDAIAPLTGSEDFAFVLEKCPGCYLLVGNGDGDGDGNCMVHNPGYDFNDEILAVGAGYWVRLTERFLN
ncbi:MULTISPECIES: M20 aminoacylase family protein [unclassified Burkholderia]|uniref:M20 aminoacylase family protein n=1 Tax=unclassified Burkholderia TaxID=2613784 RepID=UPI000F5A46A2|nr:MULTISPECIES: M20 aminoacylase family protein [unclassified Burkholderia]RQR32520.1 amidohydrolase [Burkholderia sp. Bp9131]RQR67092.1 amidohydrolase [Burkholderia sp. Bp9015]